MKKKSEFFEDYSGGGIRKLSAHSLCRSERFSWKVEDSNHSIGFHIPEMLDDGVEEIVMGMAHRGN